MVHSGFVVGFQVRMRNYVHSGQIYFYMMIKVNFFSCCLFVNKNCKKSHLTSTYLAFWFITEALANEPIFFNNLIFIRKNTSATLRIRANRLQQSTAKIFSYISCLGKNNFKRELSLCRLFTFRSLIWFLSFCVFLSKITI